MNVLIIGLGSIANKHISAIRAINPKSIIYALRSSASSEPVKDVHCIFSLAELKERPDFVIISNPTKYHQDAIYQSLQFNCPLFIEKPVLGDLKNVDRLIEAIQNSGVITYVACNMRFHPSLIFLKEFLSLDTQRINEVNIYCGSFLPDWRPGKDFRTVYSASEKMGGGVHLDLIHELDYCIWLFGLPEEVYSIKASRSSLNIDAVDSAQFSLIYGGFSTTIRLNYFRKDTRRDIEIVTDEDTLFCDLTKGSVESKVTGDFFLNGEFRMTDTYLTQMAYFINHVEAGIQPMNSFEEGVAVLKLALYE